MDFTSNRPIYLQIADYIVDNIISENWKAEERIPSVRELASEIEVNPNTVARTYSFLSNMRIINNVRGIGYFISANALQLSSDFKKNEFISTELPEVFRKMDLLNINFDQLKKLYQDGKKTQTK